MPRNRFLGLRPRGGVYWIDLDNAKVGRICESTGASLEQRELAERYYMQRLGRAYEERKLGARPRRTFAEASAKHLDEERRNGLKSIAMDEWAIGKLLPAIGPLELKAVHDGSLEPLKRSMSLQGAKLNTVRSVLQVARKILNKAARVWRDEAGRPWLDSAPLIQIPEPKDAREPYPVSWDEERRLLLPECPVHIADHVLFYVNVGPREQELCQLRWQWERRLPELGTSIFILPSQYTKAGRVRVLVLNSIAMAVIERQRGRHGEFVFTYEGKPVGNTNNVGWRRARARAAAKYPEILRAECPDGFRTLHVHDLRHTFGRRLRAAGVSDETRADLLGHSTGNITTHYSQAELRELVEAVRLIEYPLGSLPTLTVLRSQAA